MVISENGKPAVTKQSKFEDIAEELRYLDRLRDNAVALAFGVLETQDPALAHLLLTSLGDRCRASRWMCMHQRVFHGKSAYEMLADGDIDGVWERATGEYVPETADVGMERRGM
jgi:hypothetical protein